MSSDKFRAFVIGIARYEQVSRLPEAVMNDARDIASVLQSESYCGFPPAGVRVLLDNEATLHAIRAGLKELGEADDPDRTVVIFFSGHGVRLRSAGAETSALVPVDCRTSDIRL